MVLNVLKIFRQGFLVPKSRIGERMSVNIKSLYPIYRRNPNLYSLPIIIMFHGENICLVNYVLRVTSSVQGASIFSSTFPGYPISPPHYSIEFISSPSSCRATSMDIPDPFPTPLPMDYRFWQVLRATSRILTEQLYVGLSCLSYFFSAM